MEKYCFFLNSTRETCNCIKIKNLLGKINTVILNRMYIREVPTI